MATKKTIFIIPGFKHKPTQAVYRGLAKMLKKEGYSPIPVTIPWKQKTISENVEYFLKIYKKTRRKEKYILGFSYGAMIAFLAATKIPTEGLILCSLSPYFREDITKKHVRISDLTPERYEDFLKLPCSILAKKVKTKHLLMLYGDKESKLLIKRVTQAFAHMQVKEKHLLPIRKTDHNIADKRYLHTIHFAAQQMLYI
jgi:pimeloyl-ACP methyl ester carboxylesterase